jgi:hypothetical protein
MANHALVAVLGLQIGMLAEKVRDLGFDRLRQQGSSSVAQDFGELVVEHNSISADSRLPPLRNVAWPSRLRLLAPLQSVSDLSRHWFVECGDGKMRAPRSAVVNCTATLRATRIDLDQAGARVLVQFGASDIGLRQVVDGQSLRNRADQGFRTRSDKPADRSLPSRTIAALVRWASNRLSHASMATSGADVCSANSYRCSKLRGASRSDHSRSAEWRKPTFLGGIDGREAMMRSIALALALTLASSVQAMPRAPLQEPQDVIIKIREACGAGMHRVNGVCVRTPARRSASRCARGVTC